MAELLVKTACDGLEPLKIGLLTLTESKPQTLTTLAPYQGEQQALDKALTKAHGVGFPGVNGSTFGKRARVLWFGRDLALLMGPQPDPSLARHAALTD